MVQLPFSQACENNKLYILRILCEVFADRKTVLEIASGTGQHACFFAAEMPWLQWQPSDLSETLPVLGPRCSAYAGENLLPEKALDVRDTNWPLEVPDALFTANSFHIMSFEAVRDFFSVLEKSDRDDLVLCVYGPFNYNGAYTSDSNARFDQWLLQHDAASGIRSFEAVNELAASADLSLQDDYEMPANNRLLVWRRGPSKTPR